MLAPFLSLLVAMPAESGPRHQPSGTRDLIVIGRVENLDYKPVYDPEDVLGHGWISARLHVTRALRGSAPASVLSVRYFAHSYRYGDGDVRLHLRRWDNTTYAICADRGDGVRCR